MVSAATCPRRLVIAAAPAFAGYSDDAHDCLWPHQIQRPTDQMVSHTRARDAARPRDFGLGSNQPSSPSVGSDLVIPSVVGDPNE
jgi:hypothetical protein